jgi:uncharacterized GH25 family protein
MTAPQERPAVTWSGNIKFVQHLKNPGEGVHSVKLLVDLFNLFIIREELAHNGSVCQRKKLRVLQQIPNTR